MTKTMEIAIGAVAVTKCVPLWIPNGKWGAPGYEVLECHADRFVIDGESVIDAVAALFVRRLSDDTIVELLRGYVAAIGRAKDD